MEKNKFFNMHSFKFYANVLNQNVKEQGPVISIFASSGDRNACCSLLPLPLNSSSDLLMFHAPLPRHHLPLCHPSTSPSNPTGAPQVFRIVPASTASKLHILCWEVSPGLTLLQHCHWSSKRRLTQSSWQSLPWLCPSPTFSLYSQDLSFHTPWFPSTASKPWKC